MTFRLAASLFTLILVATLLAACWDKTELNKLALVSMIGIDIEPESGQKMIYFQVINPLGSISARAMGNRQAPVYTYEIRGTTYGEILSTIYKLLARKLFVAHAKIVLVSERAAKQGLRELVNFIDMQPYARTSIPILIVEEPLPDIMEHFTPLEEVPAESIDTRLKLLLRNSLLVGEQVNVNHFIERMEQSNTIVLPMIAKPTEVPSSKSEGTSLDINANKHNFIIEGGAIFQDYRMVGKLHGEQLVWYHLLNGSRGQHVRKFKMDITQITLGIKLLRIQRQVKLQSGKPVVEFKLDIAISTAPANEYLPKNRNELESLENKLDQYLENKFLAFYQMSREQGWDLLGIRNMLRKQMPDLPNPGQAATNAKVTFVVNTQLMGMGSTNQLYEGAK